MPQEGHIRAVAVPVSPLVVPGGGGTTGAIRVADEATRDVSSPAVGGLGMGVMRVSPGTGGGGLGGVTGRGLREISETVRSIAAASSVAV